jgi:hypothetical protein
VPLVGRAVVVRAVGWAVSRVSRRHADLMAEVVAQERRRKPTVRQSRALIFGQLGTAQAMLRSAVASGALTPDEQARVDRAREELAQVAVSLRAGFAPREDEPARAEPELPPFGTWDRDPDAPRCPLCGVQVKWSCSGDSGHAYCQDGTRVSRRFPGFGPPCPWAGSRVVRRSGTGVRFVQPVSTERVRLRGDEP